MTEVSQNGTVLRTSRSYAPLSTATRYSNLLKTRWKQFFETCVTNTIMRYCRCTSRLTTYIGSCLLTRSGSKDPQSFVITRIFDSRTTRSERDCPDGQKHHGTRDVGKHEPFLKKYLWCGGFWERSYYIGTAGQVSTETIERYIERTEHV